eukprot:TRINITY_DN1127_c1_g1_i1.p1 TRINITY_DN1127_c1_g1~~TRINITY_DN1127_c1_g1_i1.p1  ORF type:complete len:291 (+),score=56.68 TRINITY_DN1127_c1_g1_i1:76-948(+)
MNFRPVCRFRVRGLRPCTCVTLFVVLQAALASFDPLAPAVHTPCFMPGTLVTMADGSQRPVESITTGERVWGGEEVLYRHVDVVPAGTVLHGLDGEEPWAMGGRAFIEETGLFTTTHLDIAIRADPALEGKTVPLNSTTRVLRFDGTARAPTNITFATLANETVVYSVLLLGPSHVFPANGWITFDFFPHLGDLSIASRVMVMIYRRETRRLNEMFSNFGPEDVPRMAALLSDVSAVITKHLSSREVKSRYAGAPIPGSAADHASSDAGMPVSQPIVADASVGLDPKDEL